MQLEENDFVSADNVVMKQIPDEDSMDFLPKWFKDDMLRFEFMVYDYDTEGKGNNEISKMVSIDGYTGGFWKFYEVTNSYGHKAPLMVLDEDKPVTLINGMNYSETQTSALASSAGINAMVLNHLGGAYYSIDEKKAHHYFDLSEILKDWIYTTQNLQPEEVQAISSFID